MKTRSAPLIAGLLLAAASTASAEEAAEEVHDLLGERWYAIEVIIFERLPVMNFSSPENLVSSVYLKLGIDPSNIVYNRAGRPTHLVSDPKPIKEIMG